MPCTLHAMMVGQEGELSSFEMTAIKHAVGADASVLLQLMQNASGTGTSEKKRLFMEKMTQYYNCVWIAFIIMLCYCM